MGSTFPPRRSWSAPRLDEVDYDLVPAARRAVEGALSLVPGERLLIVTDHLHSSVAQALEHAANAQGAKVTLLVLEDLARRPIAGLPPQIAAALEVAQASVFIAAADPAEVDLRRQLVLVAGKLGLRHAHMVGVTPQILSAGMSVDPQRIVDAARALRVRLRDDSRLSVKSAAGTELEIRCTRAHRWFERSGVIRPGRWANLPTGELLTTPGSVDGRYVADASYSALPRTNGSLLAAPLTLTFEAGRVTRVESSDSALVDALGEFLKSGPDRDRVGLCGFGTNVGLGDPLGVAIADQTLPGVHISLGRAVPELSGASWDCDAQFVVTAAKMDVDVDGLAVMRAGRFLV